MTTLVLVRHGQASFGARNYDCLSGLGIRQSTVLGEYWRRIQPRFDSAWCGAMQRQRHTGEHAFRALGREQPIQTHAAFDEYDHQGLIQSYLPVVARDHPEYAVEAREIFGDPRKFQLFFEKIVACWLSGREGDTPIRETWEQFRRRVLDGVRAATPPGIESTAVFTSGGAISVVLQEALGVDGPRAFALNWRIYNASVHTLLVGRRGLSLMGFNGVAHLELQNDPQLFTFR